MSAAAPLSAELMKQFVKTFPNCGLGQGYGRENPIPGIHSFSDAIPGLTETCVAVSIPPPWQKVGIVGGCGRLIPGVTARVVKADGQLARPGESGEMHVKTISMPLGYLDNEKA